MEAEFMEQNKTAGLQVRTGMQAGYWTCGGVRGQPDWRGVIQYARASECYKPKYAQEFGAPKILGGGDQ